MLLTTQLDQYFPDLHNPALETALAELGASKTGRHGFW